MTTTAAAQPPQQAGQPGQAPALDRDQQVAFSKHGVEMKTLADVHRVASWIVNSQWNPKGMGVADCAVAIMRGVGLGMGPIQAVECIAVINGRTTVWGDMLLALCRGSGRFDEDGFNEWFDNDDNPRKLAPDPSATKPDPTKDSYTGHCVVKRIGAKTPRAYAYSIGDAKKAGLWGKAGTWTTNPKRMLIYRPRAFALRDTFTDVLQGLYDRDEMLDADVVLGQIDLGDESQTVAVGTKTEQLAAALSPPVPGAMLVIEKAPPAVEEPAEPDLTALRADIQERLLTMPPEANIAVCKVYRAKGSAEMKKVVELMEDPKDLNDLRLACVGAASEAKSGKKKPGGGATEPGQGDTPPH